jgi:Tol biopolymer transport system component
MDELSGNVLGEPEPITTPASRVESISVSPDGRLVAFSSVVEDEDIWRIGFNASTESVKGEPIHVTRGSRSAALASVFPDGQRIAFELDQRRDIALIRNDGSGLVNLTNDPSRDLFP